MQQSSDIQSKKFSQVCCTKGTLHTRKDASFQKQLGQNEVLVKVAFSAISQYDKIIMECEKQEGKIFGSEGSGTIELVGEGVDSNLIGRKVAFSCDAWSQYAVKRMDEIIVLDDSVDLRQAAASVINPLTALCVRKIIKDSGFKSFLIDGAHSQLG